MALNRSSTAFSSNILAASNPASLYGFSVYNNSASAIWIQLHDLDAVPSNGAIPKMFYQVQANSGREFFWGEVGRKFYQGLAITGSTTADTLTATGSVCWFDVQLVEGV